MRKKRKKRGKEYVHNIFSDFAIDLSAGWYCTSWKAKTCPKIDLHYAISTGYEVFDLEPTSSTITKVLQWTFSHPLLSPIKPFHYGIIELIGVKDINNGPGARRWQGKPNLQVNNVKWQLNNESMTYLASYIGNGMQLNSLQVCVHGHICTSPSFTSAMFPSQSWLEALNL